MRHSPARIEELVKIFIHATKVGFGPVQLVVELQVLFGQQALTRLVFVFFLLFPDGNWILGDVQLELSRCCAKVHGYDVRRKRALENCSSSSGEVDAPSTEEKKERKKREKNDAWSNGVPSSK